jgi:hypothetical protein
VNASGTFQLQHFHTPPEAARRGREELEKAREEYERAIARDEQDIAARCHRAEVLLRQGQRVAAAMELRRIAELDPQGAQGHIWCAMWMAVALAEWVEEEEE